MPPMDVVPLVAEACAGRTGPLAALARQDPGLVTPHQRRLIDSGVWGPPELYHVMTEATARYLVGLLDAGRCGRPDRVLEVLAVGGGEVAVTAIRGWLRDPPGWALDPPVRIALYPHLGGWEPGPGTGVRRLTSESAFALRPGPERAAVASVHCGWCGRRLWHLVDAPHPELGRVRVVTCVRCGRFDTVHTRLDDGAVHWAGGEPPDHPGAESGWPEQAGPPLTTGPPRPSAVAGSAWDAGGSTLGGHPDWIDDPQFPACPDCGRTMRYAGMVTAVDVGAGPGCFYLFVDRACGRAATVYQQS